jgi:hypothetical protein
MSYCSLFCLVEYSRSTHGVQSIEFLLTLSSPTVHVIPVVPVPVVPVVPIVPVVPMLDMTSTLAFCFCMVKRARCSVDRAPTDIVSD